MRCGQATRLVKLKNWRVKVSKALYITSLGHSGSTLLDLLVGSIPGCFSTGELIWFPWQIYRDGKMCSKKQDFCTCGKPFTQCAVWSSILRNLSGKVGFDVAKEPLRYAMNIIEPVRYGQAGRHHAVLKELYLRSHGSGLAFFWDRLLRSTSEKSWKLYDAITEETGAEWIVDSSKDQARMMALYHVRPADFKIIVLIRSAEGVLASQLKWGRKPGPSLKRWLRLYNGRIASLLAGIPEDRFLIVSYERFTANPEQERGRIARFLGIETPLPTLSISGAENHLIAGNPMRYSKEIIIRYDDAWRSRLSAEQIKLAVSFQKRLNPVFRQASTHGTKPEK